MKLVVYAVTQYLYTKIQKKIDAIIQKLELQFKEIENVEKEIKDFFNRPREEIEEEDWEIKKKLHDLRDKKNKELWETIEQLNGKKVVVITYSSD